jgi:trehalose 6-phosphate synthase
LGRDSVLVDDPRDVSATADALHAALIMPPRERHRRAQQLRARIAAHDPARWLNDQLSDLADITGRPYA